MNLIMGGICWVGLEEQLRDPKKRRNLRPVLFSVYTFGCSGGLGILSGSWWISCAFAAMLVPLVAIAAGRSTPRGKWSEILPLTILYLTFGMARANCLLKYKTWTSAWQDNRCGRWIGGSGSTA
jgi:hypothetical protein